jgi:hypothetical protein
MNCYSSLYSFSNSNESLIVIDAPIISSVSYPITNNIATIYFTPSTTANVTYQYSTNGTDYISITITPPNYLFTVTCNTIITVSLFAVKSSTLSEPSTITIDPNYIPKATITGNAAGRQILITPEYEYYVFTNTVSSYNVKFSNSTNIEYLAVGAGGNGGSNYGGGGGAGGVLGNTSFISSDISINIIVGSPSSAAYNVASKGNNTTIQIDNIMFTAYGGGCAASQPGAANSTGGSGGGGGGYLKNPGAVAITGSGYNGTSGGNGSAGGNGGAGGGGGAVSNGSNAIVSVGGMGGNGTSLYSEWIKMISIYMNTIVTDWSVYTISNEIGYIASGGAGGSSGGVLNATQSVIGGGGSGGTGTGAGANQIQPTAGISNTGGGGGGYGGNHPNGIITYNKKGGSGIAIIRTLRN